MSDICELFCFNGLVHKQVSMMYAIQNFLVFPDGYEIFKYDLLAGCKNR